jgi:hypothetical protein
MCSTRGLCPPPPTPSAGPAHFATPPQHCEGMIENAPAQPSTALRFKSLDAPSSQTLNHILEDIAPRGYCLLYRLISQPPRGRDHLDTIILETLFSRPAIFFLRCIMRRYLRHVTPPIGTLDATSACWLSTKVRPVPQWYHKCTGRKNIAARWSRYARPPFQWRFSARYICGTIVGPGGLLCWLSMLTRMMTWHLSRYKCPFKYLLIIHLRKKISRPGEKCLEDNCVQVVPPAGGLRNEPVQ